MSRAAALLAAVCIFNAGCGYHTAGHANLLPSDLRILAVPAFVNQTQTYKIEQMLTAAVVQEFGTRTHYRVVSKSEAPDATWLFDNVRIGTPSMSSWSTSGWAMIQGSICCARRTLAGRRAGNGQHSSS